MTKNSNQVVPAFKFSASPSISMAEDMPTRVSLCCGSPFKICSSVCVCVCGRGGGGGVGVCMCVSACVGGCLAQVGFNCTLYVYIRKKIKF